MHRFLFLAFVGVVACHYKPKPSELSETLFLKGESLGKIDPKLKEASGLIESRANPNMFWCLNDGQNPAEVFLINRQAEITMICVLKNIENRDWEDITIGPGPEEGKNYIYVGDIGDNRSAFPSKKMYRFPEPVFDSEEKLITEFDTLEIQLSDGERDTEAMMIDPIAKDLWIASKREDSVHLYKVAYPFTNNTMTAERMAILPLTKITAMTISADGREILMKDYDYVYYWSRSAGQSVAAALLQKPIRLAYQREEQGESICFALDRSGYYTLGETIDRPAELMFYRRKETKSTK